MYFIKYIRETILTSLRALTYILPIIYLLKHITEISAELYAHQSPTKRSKFEIHLVRFIRFKLYLLITFYIRSLRENCYPLSPTGNVFAGAMRAEIKYPRVYICTEEVRYLFIIVSSVMSRSTSETGRKMSLLVLGTREKPVSAQMDEL